MRFAQATLAVAGFVGLTALADGSSADRTGDFRLSVIGSTVLLEPANAGEDADIFSQCIGATGNDTLLERLRSLPERSRVRIHYQDIHYPEFRPLLYIGSEGFDYAATVRGQTVARWCDSQRFIWIVSVQTGG
jgi:hypothetical protein